MLRIYNTLAKQVEEIRPATPGFIQMYTCGPTVYRDAHIGNLRTYLMADWVRRSLIHSGMQVTHIKNITDVGHMRQEMLERGEDKVIAAAIREALRCKESGEEKVILTALCGHGHLDLGAYAKYLAGELVDYDYPEDKIAEAMAKVPVLS